MSKNKSNKKSPVTSGAPAVATSVAAEPVVTNISEVETPTTPEAFEEAVAATKKPRSKSVDSATFCRVWKKCADAQQTVEDMAEQLGMEVNAVRTRQYQVKKQFAKSGVEINFSFPQLKSLPKGAARIDIDALRDIFSQKTA